MNKQIAQIEDPSIKYDSPKAVFDHPNLSPQEKITILQDWEYQIRQELVADEESIKSTATTSLYEVLKLLSILGADSIIEQGSHGSKMG